MSENPYIARRKAQFEALKASAEAVQARAASEDRDLTEEELRSVKEQVEDAKKIAAEIEMLADAEVRAAKVTEVTSKVAEATENRSAKFHTQDRDPGHYRSEKDGGRYSFFADHFRAATRGDEEAKRRLEEHTRAVTQASGGTGIVPPKWLTDEYQPLARQGRAVANRVRNLPIGNDPRPLILPKQTGGADVSAQNAEGANNTTNPVWGADAYTSDKDTLTPATYAAYQDVSRQLLDSSSPAVDLLIFGDLRAAWDDKVESLVCAAILASGTAFKTVTGETGWETAPIDDVIDMQTEVAKDKRGPADLLVCNYTRFGAFRKLKDGNNRPLMPVSRYNPQNATGAMGNALVGDIEGVDVVASNGIPTGSASLDEKFAVLRSQAVILAESDLLEFTYEQVAGPSAVRMGIWGYVGTLVRNPGSVQVLTIDTTA